MMNDANFEHTLKQLQLLKLFVESAKSSSKKAGKELKCVHELENLIKSAEEACKRGDTGSLKELYTKSCILCDVLTENGGSA